MKGYTSLQRSIKKIVEENCQNNLYSDKFSSELQREAEENSALVAKLTMQDEELIRYLEEAIEESIRVMILNKKEN